MEHSRRHLPGCVRWEEPGREAQSPGDALHLEVGETRTGWEERRSEGESQTLRPLPPVREDGITAPHWGLRRTQRQEVRCHTWDSQHMARPPDPDRAGGRRETQQGAPDQATEGAPGIREPC